MRREWTDIEKIRRLPWMVAGDAVTAIFVVLTFGGPAFVLFLSELGLDNTRIGLLISLIPFCGIIAPFIAPLVARFGSKRTFITFWGVRKGVMALLLLTPAILARFGVDRAFTWVAAIIFVFGLCRAIAETGFYPWMQELIPNSIRGKFSAIDNIVATVAQMLAVAVASYVVGHYVGLGRFLVLIGIGSAIGITSAIWYSLLPGGSPSPEIVRLSSHVRGMLESLRDRNFLFFLLSLALVTLGNAIASFIPLFMKEQVGLTSGNVVLLSVGIYAGSFLSSYLWGWNADRYGSKPIMQAGLFLYAALPVLWTIIPRHSGWSAPAALLIAFIQGAAMMAWSIGWMRYMYVRAIPSRKHTSYTAVYYAWAQLVSGIGPLAVGALLDKFQGLEGAKVGQTMLGLPIDSYTPLFGLSLALLAIALLAISRLSADGPYSLLQFVSLFVRGKPLTALQALLQHRRATDEQGRVDATQRMGDAQSLLNLDELLSSLHDPSFNVRYQAIHSLTNLPVPQPKVIDALLAILRDPTSDLRLEAAWALGRMGDKRAIPVLRGILATGDPILRARCVRALATLGDQEDMRISLANLTQETDKALRMAHASALGVLRVPEALELILEMLRATEGDTARNELALAVARILGDENAYIRHWRQFYAGPRTTAGLSTAIAQAALALQEGVPVSLRDGDMGPLLGECSQRAARGEVDRAATILKTLSARLAIQTQEPALRIVLQECAQALTDCSEQYPGQACTVYILLIIYATEMAFQRWQTPDLATLSPLAAPPG